MIRPAFVLAMILTAAGAPALAQFDARANAPSGRPTQTWTTPPAAEGPVAECRTEIDCAPELEGASVRPVNVWSVRSSQVPPNAEFQPVYPIAIIADVDEQSGHERGHDRDRRRDPDWRRGD